MASGLYGAATTGSGQGGVGGVVQGAGVRRPFTAALDQATGIGTYVAMESFEGSLHGREGSFNFVRSATTSGSARTAEFFTIAPSSGTGALAGIHGSGGTTVDADGTHRIWFDCQLG
ncbi:DUF3224 domain-containing protein [Streptomyces sp. MMG1121]|uniref:DUF3224 domain-containing protein n=1 Tax=Streptomyces sp. MMG1121 TaxID=1415544 RepID=UPI0006B00B8F|nr:DUF3224 domain-containing protein [Streptomyces sp. MMG1121]